MPSTGPTRSGDDGGAGRSGGYNPRRGAKVIDFVREFLDEHFPLTAGSHRDAVRYRYRVARTRGRAQAGRHRERWKIPATGGVSGRRRNRHR